MVLSLVVATLYSKEKYIDDIKILLHALEFKCNIHICCRLIVESSAGWWKNRIRKSGEDLKVAAFVSFGQLTTDWCKILFRIIHYATAVFIYEFCRCQYLFTYLKICSLLVYRNKRVGIDLRKQAR